MDCTIAGGPSRQAGRVSRHCALGGLSRSRGIAVGRISGRREAREPRVPRPGSQSGSVLDPWRPLASPAATTPGACLRLAGVFPRWEN